MNFDDILTEAEYTKERSAEELFDWWTTKNEELRGYPQTRETRYRKHGQGLPKKFVNELKPFAYYAKAFYSNTPDARFAPCCGSESYDGIVRHNDEKTRVEISSAIDGKEWAGQKYLLANGGTAFCKPDICKIKELVKETISKKCDKSMDLRYGQNNTVLIITTYDDYFFYL